MYSPDRRTALVLTGSGADGAYHAGALRALHEAGVKIDIVAGRGIGAIGAVLSAIDGSSRLWDQKGLWRAPAVAQIYRWRWPIRVLFVLLGALAGIVASPLVFLAAAVIIYPISLFAGMVGLDAGVTLADGYAQMLAAAFGPTALPTWLPRLITIVTLAALITLVVGTYVTWRRAPMRRRSRGPVAWALLGSPLDASRGVRHFTQGLWDLLRGGAAIKEVAADDLSRRYAELLSENLGQPGFRELLLVVHDVDARRDLLFGVVKEPFRRTLFPAAVAAAAPGATAGVRRAEAFDLAGLARDHLLDVLRASLSIPGVTDPALLRFAPDGFWRGEAHRVIDRPSSLPRLLEEVAAAGAEHVIIVSAAGALPGAHELAKPRLDPLGRVNEHLAALESAALRDAERLVQHRFHAVYQIRPSHNAVGAFDLAGAYDERSDRHQTLSESMERGYEDAYRQFIEPVIAVSGEELTEVRTDR
jgi:predicted acylesterase/phospholipase RssA